MGPQERSICFVNKIIGRTGKLRLCFLQQGNLTFQLVLHPNVITIQERNVVAAGLPNTYIPAKCNALVFRIRKHSDFRIQLFVLPYNEKGVIP